MAKSRQVLRSAGVQDPDSPFGLTRARRQDGAWIGSVDIGIHTANGGKISDWPRPGRRRGERTLPPPSCARCQRWADAPTGGADVSALYAAQPPERSDSMSSGTPFRSLSRSVAISESTTVVSR